jgi:hypothetical protein
MRLKMTLRESTKLEILNFIIDSGISSKAEMVTKTKVTSVTVDKYIHMLFLEHLIREHEIIKKARHKSHLRCNMHAYTITREGIKYLYTHNEGE